MRVMPGLALHAGKPAELTPLISASICVIIRPATPAPHQSHVSTQRRPPMKWITRSHVHVDRVACPWLITRFVDSDAEFLFVPASQIDEVAKETGAIPFDAPGVELGHHERPLLVRVDHRQVRAEGPGPAAPGQDRPRRRRGRGHRHGPDRRVAWRRSPSATACASPTTRRTWQHQFEVYDALYAWCRLQVAKG